MDCVKKGDKQTECVCNTAEKINPPLSKGIEVAGLVFIETVNAFQKNRIMNSKIKKSGTHLQQEKHAFFVVEK
ncbi:MAG TPA: hypothetical protein VMT76_07645 [Puia sp.]|nr:hypothetical protein [Puia sp.]